MVIKESCCTTTCIIKIRVHIDKYFISDFWDDFPVMPWTEIDRGTQSLVYNVQSNYTKYSLHTVYTVNRFIILFTVTYCTESKYSIQCTLNSLSTVYILKCTLYVDSKNSQVKTYTYVHMHYVCIHRLNSMYNVHCILHT